MTTIKKTKKYRQRGRQTSKIGTRRKRNLSKNKKEESQPLSPKNNSGNGSSFNEEFCCVCTSLWIYLLAAIFLIVALVLYEIEEFSFYLFLSVLFCCKFLILYKMKQTQCENIFLKIKHCGPLIFFVVFFLRKIATFFVCKQNVYTQRKLWQKHKKKNTAHHGMKTLII